MKTLFSFLILLGACVFFFFFAQHHVREEHSFKACTLSEIYGELFTEISSPTATRLGVILLLALAGVATAFYPALLVLLVRYATNAAGWLVFAGVIALIGAGVNFFAMILSHTTFGFGGSTSGSDTVTVSFWLILAFQTAFALTSIVLGAVSKWASGIHHWLAA